MKIDFSDKKAVLQLIERYRSEIANLHQKSGTESQITAIGRSIQGLEEQVVRLST